MEPDLAPGLRAAGAGAGLFQRRRLVYAAGGLLALAAVLALLVARQLGTPVRPGPGALTILAADAFALALVVATAPIEVDRPSLVVFGLGGLAAVAAIGAASLPAQVALALLLLGAGYAALPGLRSFPVRLRGPAFAAALLAGGALLAAYSTQPLLSRLGGLLLVLGLAAAVGVLPFLQQLVPEEPVSASPIAWMGFIGPAVAIALAPQAQTLLDTASAPVYGAVLIGLGLLNAAWGALGAWRSADPAEAWRYSFLGDWGLALLGLGLLVPAGAAAANLVLVFVVAVRLPLYVMARPAILGHHEPRAGLGALLVAASLCGAAPFAGFPARLLLVRAATEVYWPLAPVVLIALLLWLPGSLRLARGGGSLQGRRAFGVAAVSLVSLAIGVYPAPLLAAFGGST